MEIPFYIYFIALSLVVSVLSTVNNKTERPIYLRVFPYYLCITLVIESVGVYRWSHGFSTTTLYNFFGLFEFSFYFVILHEVIRSKRMKVVVKSFFLIYPLLFLINIMFIQVSGFASITYVLGCLLVSSICVYYFYELFESSHSVELIREPAFWLCTALLFFYCCTFPYFGLANFLIDFPEIIMNNIAVLLNLMNSLLYSLFTIAFLCRIRIRKFM
jgi:hypothetical protein